MIPNKLLLHPAKSLDHDSSFVWREAQQLSACPQRSTVLYICYLSPSVPKAFSEERTKSLFRSGNRKLLACRCTVPSSYFPSSFNTNLIGAAWAWQKAHLRTERRYRWPQDEVCRLSAATAGGCCSYQLIDAQIEKVGFAPGFRTAMMGILSNCAVAANGNVCAFVWSVSQLVIHAIFRWLTEMSTEKTPRPDKHLKHRENRSKIVEERPELWTK